MLLNLFPMKNYVFGLFISLSLIGIVACGENSSDLPGNYNDVDALNQASTVLKDGFSVVVPEGWSEKPAPMGASMMVINTSQKTSDERAKLINFQDYYTVLLDSQENLGEGEYIEILKNQLKQVAPDIEFFNEKFLEVNANEAYTFEANMRQNEIDFKILMVTINGKGNDVWVLTFNTTELDWDEYFDVFQEVVNSFSIR